MGIDDESHSAVRSATVRRFRGAALSFRGIPWPARRRVRDPCRGPDPRPMRFRSLLVPVVLMTLASVPSPTTAQEPDWAAARQETVAHLQAMIRMNTVNPPGNELQVARYLDSTLKAAGIETHLFEPTPGRGALVARLKGNGSKQPVHDHGAHGRRRRRARTLVGRSVRRRDQGRLPLRARRDRRQGDARREPRDDAAPQAARRRQGGHAVARRHLRRQLRRGDERRMGDGLADREPSRADQGGVRAERGRARAHRRREAAVRRRAEHGEGAAHRDGHGARTGRPRVGPARGERDPAARSRAREDLGLQGAACR